MLKRVALFGALLSGLTTAGLAGGPEVADLGHGPHSGLTGRVTADSTPLDSVAIYAYQLADLTLDRALTDHRGRFTFSSLPPGVYKIIAHKPGFVPAVALLTRAASDAYQFLDFELSEERLNSEADGSDFWQVRARIPADVLRELQLAEKAAPPEPVVPRFQTAMQAMTGIGDSARLGSGQMTDARVGFEGQLGELAFGVSGRLREMQPDASFDSPDLAGQAVSRAVSLSFSQPGSTEVALRGETASLSSSAIAPIDMERYGVSVSQQVGSHGRSRFSAELIDESNFYRDGGTAPIELPAASRTLDMEGAYVAQVADHTFETGVRFLQRRSQEATGQPGVESLEALPYERIDLFGLGDWSLGPSLVVEYGLLSTMNDGSFSLTPHGGVVLDIGRYWSAAASVRERVSHEEPVHRLAGFVPVHYAKDSSCGAVDQHCYRVEVSRRLGTEERVSLGAQHREIADTLQLHFNDDLFQQLESLFLVRGDEIPEVQLGLTQRFGQKVMTEVQSHFARGGGGLVRTPDNNTYRNNVSYMTTSVNTEFERTSTGLLLAFHRIEQELTPMSRPAAQQQRPMAMDRLRILLTQDLNVLLDLATDLALLLDMQLSRGTTPYDQISANDLRHQVVGGIAVKF